MLHHHNFVDPTIVVGIASDMMPELSQGNFNRVFARAAHAHRIYYEARNPSCLYNCYFTAVRQEVGFRNHELLCQSLAGEKPWIRERNKQKPLTYKQECEERRKLFPEVRHKTRWNKDDPWGQDEEENFFYPDNHGFIHAEESRYLEPAPY